MLTLFRSGGIGLHYCVGRGAAADTFFGEKNDSPHFIVIEIMLAKSRAEVVEPVARQAIECFTTPEELAIAKVRDLEELVFPLGLHRKRSRHLVACAKALVAAHGGKVSTSVLELMK